MSDSVAVSSTSPEGLGPRGALLWESLAGVIGTPRGELALEVCRMADRLEELDSIIAGKGVLRLMQFRVPSAFEHYDEDLNKHVTVAVKFDAVLAEARQQAATFKALLEKLGLEGAASEPEEGSPLAKILALVHPSA